MASFFYRYTNHLTALFLVALVGMFYFFPRNDMYHLLMRSELGVIENLTVLLCLVAVYLSVKCYKIAGSLPCSQLFKAFFIFFAVGSFVLAGEEASWGQHYFGWESTEYMVANNIQKETNLHNLSNGAEQLPKILLHLAALVSIIWVVAVKVKSLQLDKKELWYWLMPTSVTLWPAVVGLAVRLWERSYVWRGIKDWGKTDSSSLDAFKELKEVNETFLLLFCVTYLASILYRYHNKDS